MLQLLAVTSLFIAQTHAECSALSAQVQYEKANGDVEIIGSVNSLLPPHSYETSYAPLVYIETENLCADIGAGETAEISADVTDKVVLIRRGQNGDCSDEIKLISLQNAGAKAVLIGSEGETTKQPSDDTAYLNQIVLVTPTRIVSNDDALRLIQMAETGAVNIKFKCNDDEYPTQLCLDAHSASAAGQYERIEETFNGHPVYTLLGYAELYNSQTFYLHDAYGSGEWYWALTWDSEFQFDSWISAICDDPSAQHPADCTSWSRTLDWGQSWEPWDVSIAPTECENPDVAYQTICVSTDKMLGGMRGTYDYSPASGFYYRRHTECDGRSGVMFFEDFGDDGTMWSLYDIRPYRRYAKCAVDKNSAETVRDRPDLCGEHGQWETLDDLEVKYSDGYRYDDASFSISLGECSDADKKDFYTQCTGDSAPDAFCMDNSYFTENGVDGTYKKIATSQHSVYGDAQYQLQKPNYLYSGDEGNLYIWFLDDFYCAVFWQCADLHTLRWVISPTSFDEAAQAGRADYIASCPGWSNGDPSQCKKWTMSNYIEQIQMFDPTKTITRGECDSPTYPEKKGQFPDFMCVGLKDENKGTPQTHPVALVDLTQYAFVGGYKKFEDNEISPLPYYVKLADDNWPVDTELFLSGGLWWFYTPADDGVGYATCDPKYDADSYSPLDCSPWFSATDAAILDNLELFECTEEDVPTESDPTEEEPNVPSLPPTDPPANTGAPDTFCLEELDNKRKKALFGKSWKDLSAYTKTKKAPTKRDMHLYAGVYHYSLEKSDGAMAYYQHEDKSKQFVIYDVATGDLNYGHTGIAPAPEGDVSCVEGPDHFDCVFADGEYASHLIYVTKDCGEAAFMFDSSLSTAGIIGIVAFFVVALLCCAAICLYFNKTYRRLNKGKAGFEHTASEVVEMDGVGDETETL